MRRRYGIDWYAGGRWYSIGRTWWTKWGALRAARCGAARVVIVLSPVAARTSAGRPATWSGPAGGAFTAARAWVGARR